MNAEPEVMEKMRHRVFLGLGSNMGDRISYLRTAIKNLPDVVNVSPLYETEPIGGPVDQPEYMNCVVELHTSLSPQELLSIGQRLEAGANRVRTIANGPRTLDVDILLYNSQTIDQPDLVIPHPRMWQRRFVVRPLFDIAPDLAPHQDLDSEGDVRQIETDWVDGVS